MFLFENRGLGMGRGRGIGSQVAILLLVTSMLFSHLSMPLELDEAHFFCTYIYCSSKTLKTKITEKGRWAIWERKVALSR
jgi:hypothetical protein